MKEIPANVLINAYAQGVFPMAEGDEIFWFSPKQRGVIPLDERFHVPKNLAKLVRKEAFVFKIDESFAEVMTACADRETTWINECIFNSYKQLFELGLAHSFECWDEDGLQGGLYGVAIGRAFFGESMFSRKKNASKVALVHLVSWLRENDFLLLDTQWMTDHLRQFGGMEVPRPIYMQMLEEALADLLYADSVLANHS